MQKTVHWISLILLPLAILLTVFFGMKQYAAIEPLDCCSLHRMATEEAYILIVFSTVAYCIYEISLFCSVRYFLVQPKETKTVRRTVFHILFIGLSLILALVLPILSRLLSSAGGTLLGIFFILLPVLILLWLIYGIWNIYEMPTQPAPNTAE